MLPAQQLSALNATGCEVAVDNLTRQLYATDASHYQIVPAAVAFPKSPAQASSLIKAAVASYRSANGLDANAEVPADAVTSSASGLDPHISVANALIQSVRVAKARSLPLERVRKLMDACTEGRDLGVLGEAGVNVLRLNVALDKEGGV